MSNRFGIPDMELNKVRLRDSKCVYCHITMIKPKTGTNRGLWATIEHLNFDGPFYWNENLNIDDVVICCSRCNSSRGIKKLETWFHSPYCLQRRINASSVSKPVKDYINRHRY